WRGYRTLWNVVETVQRWPDGDLVRVWPDLVIACDRDEYVAAGAYRGWYERAEVAVLARLTPAGGLAVDVGANTGYHTSVLAGLVGPAGRVVAFEPAPATFRRLRRLVEGAPLPNVIAHPWAVGAAAGAGTLRNLD